VHEDRSMWSPLRKPGPCCYAKLSVLELEELASAVGGFAEGDDAGVTNHLFQRLHVLETVAGFRRGETDRVAGDRVDPAVLSGLRRRDREEPVQRGEVTGGQTT